MIPPVVIERPPSAELRTNQLDQDSLPPYEVLDAILQRFVDDTPWAHLDIAGTAMGAPKTDINHSWGSGYGVRLLERLVAEYYEAKR